MRNGELIYGNFPAEELSINENELRRRLGVNKPEAGSLEPEERSSFEDVLEKCRERLMDALECRYAWVKVPAEFPEEGTCRLGSLEIESRDLCKNLRGCREAVLMGVTLGMGADRLLMRLSRISQSEHFITDALSSAAAEALCNEVDRRIRETLAEESACRFHPRYSPGYGDCSIEVQKPLLEMLQAQATLGITLNDVFLMTPVKSITAIMGIER